MFGPMQVLIINFFVFYPLVRAMLRSGSGSSILKTGLTSQLHSVFASYIIKNHFLPKGLATVMWCNFPYSLTYFFPRICMDHQRYLPHSRLVPVVVLVWISHYRSISTRAPNDLRVWERCTLKIANSRCFACGEPYGFYLGLGYEKTAIIFWALTRILL